MKCSFIWFQLDDEIIQNRPCQLSSIFYKSSGINRSLYKVKHIQHFLSDYSVVIKWTIICFCFSWVYLEDLWFLNAELTGVHDFIVVIEHHFSCWCVVRLLFGFQSVFYEVLETILCLLIHFTYSFQICFNPTKRISYISSSALCVKWKLLVTQW